VVGAALAEGLAVASLALATEKNFSKTTFARGAAVLPP
jgi:hypothetical protein